MCIFESCRRTTVRVEGSHSIPSRRTAVICRLGECNFFSSSLCGLHSFTLLKTRQQGASGFGRYCCMVMVGRKADSPVGPKINDRSGCTFAEGSVFPSKRLRAGMSSSSQSLHSSSPVTSIFVATAEACDVDFSDLLCRVRGSTPYPLRRIICCRSLPCSPAAPSAFGQQPAATASTPANSLTTLQHAVEKMAPSSDLQVTRFPTARLTGPFRVWENRL